MLIFRPHHCRARQGDTVVLVPYILYTLCTTDWRGPSGVLMAVQARDSSARGI